MKPRFVFNEDIGRSTWLDRSPVSERARSPVMYPGEPLYRSEQSFAPIKTPERSDIGDRKQSGAGGSGSGKATFSRAPKMLDQWRGRRWFPLPWDDDDDPPPCPAGASLPPHGPVPSAGSLALEPASRIATLANELGAKQAARSAFCL
jgi:hypothetical protein